MIDFVYNGKEIKDLDFNDFCAFLLKNGNKKKADFDEKIVKTHTKIYGFSAKEIELFYKYFSKTESKILTYPSNACFEVTLLQGLLTVKNKELSLEKRLDGFFSWAKNSDNWAHCDMVASKLIYKEKEREEVFSFALKLAKAEEEFVARCGIVLMFKFLDGEYLVRIFHCLNNLDYGRYYVDMAVSWLCATALINHKNETLDFLKNSAKINDFVFTKTLQKARESFRIPAKDKAEYKSLILERRNKK